ncbi:MAG: hypothetical protein QOH21_2072, partial [Acidobacteriota bacterium]|nr:hypothetical protein [Acidobacteriota bacterium]
MRNVLAALVLFAALNAGAATLEVTIDRGEVRGPLEVHVGTRLEGEESLRWMGIRRLAADERTLTLDDLPAGIVAVQVRGAGALERAAAQVRLDGASARMNVPIRVKTIRGAVTDDGVPVAHAKVRFIRNDDLWDAE